MMQFFFCEVRKNFKLSDQEQPMYKQIFFIKKNKQLSAPYLGLVHNVFLFK